MAAKKKTDKAAASKAKTAKKQKEVEQIEMIDGDPVEDKIIHKVLPYVWVLLAIFCAICIFSGKDIGILGDGIKNALCRLFAGASVAVPVMLVVGAFFWKSDVKNVNVIYKLIYAILILVCTSVLLHFIFGYGDQRLTASELSDKGFDLIGGGIIGGCVCTFFVSIFGRVFSIVMPAFILIVSVLFFIGLTPKKFFRLIKERYERHAAIAERKTEEDARRREKEEYMSSIGQYDDGTYAPADVDVKTEDTAAAENIDIDKSVFDKAMEEEKNTSVKSIVDDGVVIEAYKGDSTDGADGAESADGGKIDLHSIFAENGKLSGIDMKDDGNFDESGAEIDLKAKTSDEIPVKTENIESEHAEKPMNVYRFPPITLLKKPPVKKNVDVSGELEENAKKLVATLNSFNVKTQVVNISRGPTLTRYELAPEAGTRVRAIANLVDDISMNLATSGVRIEAPIPGKCAVGIEVPNKTVSTVYVRELIDSPAFKDAPSRLNAALGIDVAGTPVYIDLPKMPHLLIAGATGMGKSVCLNSIIVSILYKAMPSEVKFIFIDPKKVELGMYNGIPHLLVPVVTEPKKAAGALHWAVTEMERRFELIEDVGARDIKGYNSITKDDPEKEHLPHIVIVIDELADLMMTSPDEVEASICRLAQKARAAGMCLIIGTQRPSVDVITGLIKANIPSRIAFTVASQVDSRTIIDIQGAEKLIGRGDMLYAPVGFAKPLRVQGAFVSDDEIEQITQFLKENSGKAEYSDEIAASIEKEAEKCSISKKGKNMFDNSEDSGDEEADPMLKAAIELAVESGKISTSLIQRRLSLGYGRAAKLIDKMEAMGIVSAPEGQKPRSVLISKEQYMEMRLNRDDVE